MVLKLYGESETPWGLVKPTASGLEPWVSDSVGLEWSSQVMPLLLAWVWLTENIVWQIHTYLLGLRISWYSLSKWPSCRTWMPGLCLLKWHMAGVEFALTNKDVFPSFLLVIPSSFLFPCMNTEGLLLTPFKSL